MTTMIATYGPSMRVYIAGPMRGIAKFNFPAFNEASELFASLGHEPVNPAAHDMEVYPAMESWPGFATGDIEGCPEFDLAGAILWDLQQVATCDAVAILPGWQASSGARLEVDLARFLGKPILDARTGAPWSETVLEEAERIVNGARRWDYGTPKDNHGRTAQLWGGYLGMAITGRDVCLLNILQKCSRDHNAPIRDNLVDIAGYARNAELVEG